jgi:hypothetical protein
MICPFCYKHKLLQAEGRWYCPYCYRVYNYFPVYGSKFGHHKNPPGVLFAV